MKSERFIIVVAGMHRSGTSAMTRVLSLSGCDLPAHLLDASDSNEAGHWESAPIVAFNDTLLESAGSDWEDWTAVSPDWFASSRADQYKSAATTLLEEEFGESRLMVVKDPRICRLLPFWLDVMTGSGYSPRLIIPVRNPLEVAQSIAARNGIDPYYNQLLWLRHVLESEADSRATPRFFCAYDDLLNDWQGLLKRAGRALGVSWPRRSAKVSEEIDGFLTPRLRHYNSPDPTRSESDAVLGWVKTAYGVLRGWAEAGEDEEGKAALDAIRQELEAGVRNFGRLIYRGQKSGKDALQLRETSQVLEVEVTRLQDLERHLHETIAGKDREIETGRERIEGYESQAGKAADEIVRLEELERQLNSIVAERDEALQAGQALAVDLSGQVARLEADVERLAQAERDLKAQAEDLDRKWQAGNAEWTQALSRLEAQEASAARLEAETNTREAVLSDAIEEVKRHLAEAVARETEMSDAAEVLRHHLAEAVARETDLSDAAEALQRDLAEALARESSLDDTVTNLKSLLIQAEEALRQRVSDVAVAEARIAGEKQIRDQFEQIVHGLRDYNEALEADLRQERNRTADEELAWHRREIELAAAVEDLGNRLSQAESAMRQKAAQADDFAGEVSELQALNLKMGAEIKTLRGELDDERLVSGDQYEERQREILALQAHVEMLETTVATLRDANRSLDTKKENLDRLLRIFSTQKRFALLKKLEIRRMASVLRESGLLDGEWYRTAYKDVQSSGADPYVHYLQFGVREGRMPMPPEEA